MKFPPEKIREISLEYVVNLLENDLPDDDVKDDVALTNIIHIVRKLCVNRSEEDDCIDQEDINEVYEKMKKQGSKYNFIVKAGNNCMNCIGQLYAKIWPVKKSQTNGEIQK